MNIKTDYTKSEAEVLNDLALKINSTNKLEDIWKYIYNYLYDTFHIENAWLSIIDLKKQKINITCYLGNYPSLLINRIKSYPISLNEEAGWFYRTYTKKKPYYIRYFNPNFKLKKFEKTILELFKFKSFLHVPLIVQDRVIGIASFANSTDKLILHHEQLLKILKFTNLFSGAVYNSQLLLQSEESRQKAIQSQLEIQNLNELAKLINSTTNIKEILNFIRDFLYSKYRADAIWLLGIDEERKVIFPIEGICNWVSKEDEEYLRHEAYPLSETGGIFYSIYKRKKQVYISHSQIKKFNKKSSYEINLFRLLGKNDFISLPLLHKGNVIGLINITSNDPDFNFHISDIGFLSTLGEQVTGVIRNYMLMKKAEESRKEIEILNNIARNINSTNELSAILNSIIHYLNGRYGIDTMLLFLKDRAKNELYFSNSNTFIKNIPEETINFFTNLRVPLVTESGTLYRTCRRKRIFCTGTQLLKENLSVSRIDRDLMKYGKLKYAIQIPLILHGEILGVFITSSYGEFKDFTKEEINNIAKFADQITGSINNSLLLSEAKEARFSAEQEKKKSEKLLLNILPSEIAEELKTTGICNPTFFDSVSVMFTDFKGFTLIAEKLSPNELVKELDACFVQFDKITERFNLEKLKTIGDSYMCAGGIPKKNKTHAIDCVLAALEIQGFMNIMKSLKAELGIPYWELRLGIHSGPLVAGVIGEKKFAYDVWGDTVNTASRMESSGTPGMINISGTTYGLVKEFFNCEYRGRVKAKNKGEVDMYYVYGLKPEFSQKGDGKTPNGKFWEKYGLM